MKGNTVRTVTDGVSWRAGATAAFDALLRLVPAMASQSVFVSKLQPGRHFRKISGTSRGVNNIGQTARNESISLSIKKKKKKFVDTHRTEVTCLFQMER